jgi:hypothetical protein
VEQRLRVFPGVARAAGSGEVVRLASPATRYWMYVIDLFGSPSAVRAGITEENFRVLSTSLG